MPFVVESDADSRPFAVWLYFLLEFHGNSRNSIEKHDYLATKKRRDYFTLGALYSNRSQHTHIMPLYSIASSVFFFFYVLETDEPLTFADRPLVDSLPSTWLHVHVPKSCYERTTSAVFIVHAACSHPIDQGAATTILVAAATPAAFSNPNRINEPPSLLLWY